MARKTVVLSLETKLAIEKMGVRIKKARLRRNVLAEALAELVGISKGTLSSAEKGEPTVSIGAYAAVLNALDMIKDLELIAVDREGRKNDRGMRLQQRKRATKQNDKKQIEEGEIIGIDVGAILNGWQSDAARTFIVGDTTPEKKELVKVTKESFFKGIEQFKSGNRLGDISSAIQQHAESNGFGVVRAMVGHGIGREMHEDPQVPNYGKRGSGTMLKKGLCIAIEPMITMGSREIIMEQDGWTVRTKDRLPAAHFEHTVAVVQGKADILSSFDYIEEVLGNKAI